MAQIHQKLKGHFILMMSNYRNTPGEAVHVKAVGFFLALKSILEILPDALQHLSEASETFIKKASLKMQPGGFLFKLNRRHMKLHRTGERDPAKAWRP